MDRVRGKYGRSKINPNPVVEELNYAHASTGSARTVFLAVTHIGEQTVRPDNQQLSHRFWMAKSNG